VITALAIGLPLFGASEQPEYTSAEPIVKLEKFLGDSTYPKLRLRFPPETVER
jgi:hypothetical protein